MTRTRKYLLALALVASALVMTLVTTLVAPAVRTQAAGAAFIEPFNTVSVVASTVPRNGDVNPYGVAVVPSTIGNLTAGNILVSNFNNRKNLQGTGTTIVQISPGGTQSLFAEIAANKLPGPCPGGVGLTTALVALNSGWVIVGSLPTANGLAATAQAGCLIVLDSAGHVAEVFSGAPINGPWDMTALDAGTTATLFFTNVLNGTVAASPNVVNQATVVRMVLSIQSGSPPSEVSQTIVGSGFAARTDPAALVIGPTGLGLGSNGTLYVADSLNNRVAAITRALSRQSSAGTGRDVSIGGALKDPLALAIAPNGDILTTNGNDGNLVETTPNGMQVATKLVDSAGSPPGAGNLFGLAVVPGGSGVYFANDGTNTLNLLH